MAKLAAYRAKRDFGSTAEPAGADSEPGGEGRRFVIQQHAASRLHYDLRLELDGVMKSWAVTRGPSLVPGDKRLAIHTEDHPVEYNDFEGTIPKGQYGGGTVQIWDRGTWEPGFDPHFGYGKGHLEFRLKGEKLAGSWHLVRIRKRSGEKQDPWLLIKQDDEAARAADEPDILLEKPLSVASGRSMEEIASAPDGAVWNSNRGLAAYERAAKAAREPSAEPKPASPSAKRKPAAKPKPAPAAAKSRKPRAAKASAAAPAEPARADPIPRIIEPCLADLVATVPNGPNWLHEIKWDGYRLIAFKKKGTVRLQTRRGHDWTHRFPSIAEAVGALSAETAILDGEAIIEGEGGVSSFAALQDALSDKHAGVARDAILYAFDLLYLDGADLRPLPLEERKGRLAAILPAGTDGHLRLGEHLEADGRAMMRSATELGLEGVISKRRDKPYRSGRNGDWVKMKCVDRQEFAVIGFTDSAADGRGVGSLVVGYNENGAMRLAGRAGTGFTAEVARALRKRLEPTRRTAAPLAKRPTAEERRGVRWVEPELVAEVEFRGWTGDDRLRQAAYKGLREDKPVADVVRERPAGKAEPAADPRPARGTAENAAKTAKPAGRATIRSRNGGAEIAGVRVTHPERVLWEETGTTKEGLAQYYASIADWLLPQIADRPLSLVRCPEGAHAQCFFQKHAWAGLGDTVGRRTLREQNGDEEEVLWARDLAGIVSLVQASVLEIHVWGSTMDDPERADRIVMDLDPGEGVPFGEVIAGAREVKERLAALGLESFAKTTGGKGLHVVVPLSGPASWADTKAFAKSIADGMEADSPDRFLAKASKQARRGRIYVDYLRNGRGATAIAPYSTRARPGATVSVPVRWEELKASLDPARWTVLTVPDRLRRLKADPWTGIDACRQGLPNGAKATGRSRGKR